MDRIRIAALAAATALPAQEVNYTGSVQVVTGPYIFTSRTNRYA